ncbi:hypothetical protein SLEP1_g27475 [Rubroshorea leprosula]|uniref:Uncharacterized protein n=1 Tax=Rubroshorea leprosula TaxID=152421 RepID=A0AAV5K1V4_9ROSI|nr:hypothetical protein SLEP1_g27475 [Rubroshorea leprosula]
MATSDHLFVDNFFDIVFKPSVNGLSSYGIGRMEGEFAGKVLE